ncbi:hypothetical protein BGZ94_006888 [Podila epigama]|nr:hypothetical protein BGZ94_006888 [Podila epigama]
MSSLPPPPPPLPPADSGAAAPPTSTHSTVYVGHLSPRTERRDVEELFEKYGRVVSVELKHGGFAFVEYEDPRDADDAVSKLNGYELDGNRISVEWSRRSGGPGSGCFLCGGTGHWARECPEASEKGMDVKSGKCFKCGEPGHLARFCRGQDSRRYPPPPDYRRGPPPPPRYGRGRSPPYGRDPYDYGYRGRGYSRSPDRGYGPSGYRGRSPYHHGGYRGRSPSPYYRDGGRGRSPSPYGQTGQKEPSHLHVARYVGQEDEPRSPQEYTLRIGKAIRTIRKELPEFFDHGLCDQSIYASNIRLIESSHTNVSIQGSTVYFLLAGAVRWSFKMWFRNLEFEIQSIRVNDRGGRGGLGGMDFGGDTDSINSTKDISSSHKCTGMTRTFELEPSGDKDTGGHANNIQAVEQDIQCRNSAETDKTRIDNRMQAADSVVQSLGQQEFGGTSSEGGAPSTSVTVRWSLKGTTRPSVVLTSSGPTSPPPSSYSGIFVYEFDDQGLVNEHRIENIQPSPSPEAIQRAFAWWGWLISRTRPAAAAASGAGGSNQKRLGLGCMSNK